MKIRKRGKWYHLDARVDGKRIQVKLKTTDRDTALMRARAYLADREVRFIGEPILLKDYISQYLEWSKSRKPDSHYNEHLALERLQKELPLVHYLDEITPVIADRFITKILEPRQVTKKDGSVKTLLIGARGVNFYIRTLRSIFTTAVTWRFLAENPFKGVRLMAAETIEPRALSQDEIQAVYTTVRAKAPVYLDLFLFYLLTGLRRSEALRLTWGDIDQNFTMLKIRRAKGHKFRTVPIPPAAVAILRKRRDDPQPFLFKKWAVTHAFKRIAIAAGVPDVSLHDLRRTYGTMLAQVGVSDLLIQKWLGHSNREVTANYYIGMPSEVGKVMKQLEGKLTGNRKKPRKRGDKMVTK